MRRLALLISCFLILLSTSVVRAKLGVSPMLLSLEAQPGTTVEVMVKAYVTSPSDSEIDVRLADLQDQRLKNFPWRVPQPALAGEGHDSPNSCQARISVESPGTLHPDQDGRIAIPVTIDVSEDANSYYYAALVIRETSLKEGPLVVRGELVVPIFVRPRGAFYPFDIDVKGIVSTKDLSMMAATLSVPSSVILYQQDDTNNYAGSLSAFELATNFPVQMTASISPSESVLAKLSTETPPSHNGGRTQFDLKVIANNVNLVGLTAGSHGVTLGDLTVQVIPDFSMSYSAQYLSMCKDGSRYSKPWFAAVGAYINQEKRKLDEAALVRFRGQECFFRKLGWLALQSRSVEILLDDNEEILEKAFYQTRLINGCLANADLWLEMLRSHYYDEKWLQRAMREWLQQEAIPWVLTFLGQWQQWQQTQEAINWQHQLDQACFLPTPDGALMSDPLVPMPSVASIGLMPMLPQEEMGSSTKDSTEHLFLDFYPFKGRELRSGLLEMMKDTHQLVIVDPRLGGEENLALCAEDVSLEVALDLIGLSLDAQWERYPGYYYLKPAPIVSMQQPFFFSRQGDKPNAELIKQNHNLQSDWFARCAYFLSEEIGIPIVCSPKATGNVTARLHDVPLEVALDALCISSGNQWKKGDDFYLIERFRDKPLSLNYPIEKSMPDSNEPTPGDLCWYWEDTPLEKVVANLSFETETNLVLDANLDPEQRVTLTCEDCSLEGVLNKLCRTLGCSWKKTPYFYWILPSQCDADQPVDDISKVEVVDEVGETLDNQVFASESQKSELQQRIMDESETSLFEQSLRTPRGLARDQAVLSSIPLKRVCEYVNRDQLPELYRLLNDESFYRYAQAVCYIIASISTPEDIQSIEVLQEFVRRPIKTSDVEIRIKQKLQVFKYMGVIDSERVRTIQRDVLTEEGFQYYTDNWLHLVPLENDKKYFYRRKIAAQFRGYTVEGLAMSSDPEDQRLISRLHEAEYERCIKDGNQFLSYMTHLSSARAVSEYIADHGRQSYLDICRTDEERMALKPYIHKYTISPFGDRAEK